MYVDLGWLEWYPAGRDAVQQATIWIEKTADWRSQLEIAFGDLRAGKIETAPEAFTGQYASLAYCPERLARETLEWSGPDRNR